MPFGEPLALLTTVTVPASLPAAVGAKFTSKVRLCFGVSVAGVLAPLKLKPAPLSPICVICTVPFPEFVTVTGSVEELPVFTFPKVTSDVLNESANVAATPVPLRLTTAGEFGALLATVRLPFTAPADCGANSTLKLLVWPAAKEIGRASGPMLYPLPPTLAWVIVSVPVPLLENCMVWELESPTVTFPKLAVPGVIVRAGCSPVPVTPITALAPCEVEIVMFPLTFSEAAGLNETSNVALCPVAKVTGVLKPLEAKFVAFTETPESVKLTFPEFVSVTVLELEVPAFKLPNDKLAGFAVSDGDAVMPVPVRAIASDESDALLAMVIDPASVPAALGANVAESVTFDDGLIVTGVLTPLM
jgi:hypothetical protein